MAVESEGEVRPPIPAPPSDPPDGSAESGAAAYGVGGRVPPGRESPPGAVVSLLRLRSDLNTNGYKGQSGTEGFTSLVICHTSLSERTCHNG